MSRRTDDSGKSTDGSRKSWWDKVQEFGNKEGKGWFSGLQTNINTWLGGINIPSFDTNVKIDKSTYWLIAFVFGGIALLVRWLRRKKKKKEKILIKKIRIYEISF